MNVSMTINGEQVSHDVEPRLLLVHYIRETVAHGLENAPRTFLGLLRGENFGKQLVKLT